MAKEVIEIIKAKDEYAQKIEVSTNAKGQAQIMVALRNDDINADLTELLKKKLDEIKKAVANAGLKFPGEDA